MKLQKVCTLQYCALIVLFVPIHKMIDTKNIWIFTSQLKNLMNAHGCPKSVHETDRVSTKSQMIGKLYCIVTSLINWLTHFWVYGLCIRSQLTRQILDCDPRSDCPLLRCESSATVLENWVLSHSAGFHDHNTRAWPGDWGRGSHITGTEQAANIALSVWTSDLLWQQMISFL